MFDDVFSLFSFYIFLRHSSNIAFMIGLSTYAQGRATVLAQPSWDSWDRMRGTSMSSAWCSAQAFLRQRASDHIEGTFQESKDYKYKYKYKARNLLQSMLVGKIWSWVTILVNPL